MTKIERIGNTLLKSKTQELTAAQIAKRARVDRSTVYKRVCDLRRYGMNITSNVRTVKGRPKTFYRTA